MDNLQAIDTNAPRPAGADNKILPLTLSGVNFEVGGMRLLKDLTLTLEAGTRTVLLGPNGAGKSLFLRVCHGLLRPTSGQITWHGPAGDTAARHQAMVFQRPVMLRRSVWANLAYVLKSRDLSRTERRPLVDEMLQKTGLLRLAKVPARSLSYGEQQRLAMARAWLMRPEILFLDEPTANLDPAATHALEDIMESIHQTGTKIILATHDLAQANRIADDVLFMYRGRILENAPAAQFFKAPQNDLAAAFLKGELLWWHRQDLKPPSEVKTRWQK